MKDEKGITLIELLAAVVIAGLIIVPLLTTITGTFTRTIKQGEETQLMYFAQEIMEGIRSKGYTAGKTATKYWCINNNGCSSVEDFSVEYDALVEITVDSPQVYKAIQKGSGIESYVVTVKATSLTTGLNVDPIELFTVVKK